MDRVLKNNILEWTVEITKAQVQGRDQISTPSTVEFMKKVYETLAELAKEDN